LDQLILFALLGLGTGALIAGIGLGVVLSYRGAGILNLAVGASAMVGGYLFGWLRTEGLGAAPAFVLALAGTIAFGAAVELLVFRPLRSSSPLSALVASLGVLITAQAAVELIAGRASKVVPSVLPEGLVTLFGTRIPVAHFWLAGIVVLAAALLWALYRWSQFGLSTRAASESQASAMLAGLATDRLALGNAVLASAVAGAMGILAAAVTQLDTVILPLQVVPALGAAVFARFTSFPITCLAGLLIGVAQSLLYLAQTKPWFPTTTSAALPGVGAVLNVAVIVVALWLRGSPLPTRGELVEARLPEAPRPQRWARPALLCVVAVVAALFVVPFDLRDAIGVSIAGTIVGLSFVVLAGYVGQVSLLQVPLAGVAGFAVYHLTFDAGLSFPVASVCAIAAATITGFVAGACALRVRGVSVAVVTLAATVAIQQFVFTNPSWGANYAGNPMLEPRVFGVDVGAAAGLRAIGGGLTSPALGLMLLAVATAIAVLVVRLRQSAFGSRMLAVRSNERAAAAAGVDVRGTKARAYAVSSCIAGVGGVAWAYGLHEVNAEQFGVIASLQMLAYAYVGGITLIPGALVTGLMTADGLVPHVLHAKAGLSPTWIELVAGLALIACLRFFPAGIAGSLRRRRRVGRANPVLDARAPAPAGEHAG
jgi:branched-chain amino acid transport system permease protein